MSGEMKYKTIVLFPSELRAAGRAIRIATESKDDDKDANNMVASIAIQTALRHLIMADADDDYIVLATEPIIGAIKKETAQMDLFKKENK